ncbi:MAG: SH3 domain-containing protein [Anaerolineae bacterium]|nr:SH3 domain-containing protein [Anaerolineae bacterium]
MLAQPAGDPVYLPLQVGSPAIDAADARFCPTRDQVGTPRPQGSGCDIGAIEWSAAGSAKPDRNTAEQAQTECTVTTTHALNFRDGPGGRRIGLVREGAEFPVAGIAPGWFHVEYRGASGWISADYVAMRGECE